MSVAVVSQESLANAGVSTGTYSPIAEPRTYGVTLAFKFRSDREEYVDPVLPPPPPPTFDQTPPPPPPVRPAERG